MEIQNNTTPIIISWSASGSKNYSQLTDKSAASGSIIFSAQDKCIYANGVKFALSESEVQTLINNSISGLNVDNEKIKTVLGSYITEYAANVKRVDDDINALSGAINNSETGINAKINSLSGSIKDLDDAVSGANGLSKRIDDNKTFIEDLEKSVSGTISGTSGLSARIDANSTNITALQNADTQLWAGLTAVNNRVSGIDTRVSEAQEDIATLQTTVEGLSKITNPEEVDKAVETINKVHAEIIDPNNASGIVGTFIDAVHGVLNGFGTETDASGVITYTETVKGAIASGVQQAITAASGMNSTTTVEGSTNIKVTASGSNNDHSYKIEASGLATSTELTNTKNELLTGIASGLANAISGASGMNKELYDTLHGEIENAQSGATLKWTVI